MAIVSPRAQAAGQSYAPVPIDWEDEKEHRRKLAEAINRLLIGDLNINLDVTLTANSTTTVINDFRIGTTSNLLLAARTANAAAALATTYPSSQGKATATLTHANNAQTDRDFRISIIG